jgi:acyl-CoA synthetase (NDP forming)
MGWGVVLKATAPHLVQRPDLSHVARDINDAEAMREAWETLNNRIDDAEHAGFVVQRMAPPGIPLSITCVEDPLFGPFMSFGVAGTPSDLLGDRSYRIPPITDVDAQSMVQEIKAAPLLFGYRGSERVDIARVEDLVQRVSQLKNDLSEVVSLELTLVQAGARACSVLAVTCQIASVPDARRDWFVRRLTVPAGDTLPD